MSPEITPSGYPGRDPQLFYELARDRLTTQLAMLSALDQKLSSLVGFASGLLGVLAAVIALAASNDTDSTSIVYLVLLGAAAVPYSVAAVIGIRAYRAREWSVGPDLEEVWKTMWGDESDERVKWGVARDYWAYYNKNRDAHGAKVSALHSDLVAVVIQTLVVVSALALVAVGI